MTKGRYRVFQAKLRAAEVDPHFEKICVFAVLKRTSTATIFKMSVSKWISGFSWFMSQCWFVMEAIFYPPLPHIFWTAWTWGFTRRWHLKYTIHIQKKLSKSRLSDPFFWEFLVISELGSQIYIVKSAILGFERFFWFFVWNEIFSHRYW